MEKRIIKLVFSILFILTLIVSCSEPTSPEPNESFSSPFPANNATNQETDLTLSWIFDGEADYFEVYFGENSTPTNKVSNCDTTFYFIGDLEQLTTYYWKIVAIKDSVSILNSSIWKFTTKENIFFTNPQPSNNSTNQETDLTLSWNFDGVADYFEIYLGETNSPTNKIAEVDSSFFYVENLNELTEYFWSIVAVTQSKSKSIQKSTLLSFTRKNTNTINNTKTLETINSPTWRFTTKENIYFTNPQPSNNSTNQETDLTLSWIFDGEADYFKLYFGENPTPENLYADSLLQENFQILGLMLQTDYYWKVVAVVPETSKGTNKKPDSPNMKALQTKNSIKDKSKTKQALQRKMNEKIKSDNERSSEIESPIWNFETRYPNVEDGYKLFENLVQTELPSYVNIMFQVTDMEGIGVDNLETSDFEVKEDNQPVSPTESAMNIKKKDEINYTLKTVLMLDNSASVTPDLTTIKEAAVSLVENITSQQEIAIYSFSESVNLLQDFTDDVSSLTSAINSIQTGYASTNLYGAIIEGVGRWDDFYNIDAIEQGVLIALTDGSDTQGSSTLNKALSAIDDKNVYMVGLGNEMEPEILQQLGTAGFFYGIQIVNLVEIFIDIQNDIIAFANSFYWLNYMSPKREGNHTLTLTIPANFNTGDYSSINSSFSAEGFYGVLPGIALNVDPENGYPEGIENLTIPDENTYLIEATTFFGSEIPIYDWSVIDESIAVFTIDSLDNSKIYIYSGGTIGSTILNVIDSANNFSKDIDIHVEYGSGILLNATTTDTLGIYSINLQPIGSLELTASSVLVSNIPSYTWSILDETIATIEVTGDSTATITAVSEEGETILTVEDTINNLQRDFPVSINNFPTEGLIAEYLFTNGRTEDTVGDNDGVNIGADPDIDRFVEMNNTLRYDGNSNWVYINDNDVFEFFNNDFSISLWLQIDDVSQEMGVISKYDSDCDQGWTFRIRPDTTPQQYYLLCQGSIGYSQLIVEDDDIMNNSWHQITLIREAEEKLSIYVDGEFKSEVDDNSGTIANTNIDVFIGKNSWENHGYFDGMIDDVRIYNRVLSENEILGLYHEGGWDN